MGRRSLLFNSAVYVLGQFVSRTFGFVLLLIYARFLQPADFGITGALGAYGQILSACLLLGLHGAVFKHYFDHRDDVPALRSYLTSVFSFQLVVSSVAIVALDAFGASLWQRFTSGSIPFHPYVRLMLWVTFLSTLTTIPQTVYQAQERSSALVGFQLLQGLAAVAIGVLFVALLRERALGMLRSQLVSALLLALVFTALFCRQWLSRHLQWAHVRAALRFGLPLLPHSIGTILMQTVDRMMLEKYAPLDEVGQYSIAMALGLIVAALAGGINQAWSPHLFRTMREEPEHEARNKAQTFAALFVALFALVSLIGGLFAHDLVRLFLGARYLPAVPYLVPFIIGNLIGAYWYLPSAQLFLAGKTTWFLLATAMATAVSIGLNLWFLPRGGGAMAAAWIFVAGTVVQVGVILVAALRFETFRLLRWRHALVLAATIVPLALVAGGGGWWLKAAIFGGVSLLIYVLLLRGNLEAIIPT
jgi:O-antigen/teichoic acid export membrane protein